MEVTGGADVHLQPVEDPMPEQAAALKGGWDSEGRRSLCCCSSVLGGLQRAVMTHARAAWERLRPVVRTYT